MKIASFCDTPMEWLSLVTAVRSLGMYTLQVDVQTRMKEKFLDKIVMGYIERCPGITGPYPKDGRMRNRHSPTYHISSEYYIYDVIILNQDVLHDGELSYYYADDVQYMQISVEFVKLAYDSLITSREVASSCINKKGFKFGWSQKPIVITNSWQTWIDRFFG